MKPVTPLLLAVLFCIVQICGLHCSGKQDAADHQNAASNGQASSRSGTANRVSAGGTSDFVAASSAAMPAVVHIKTRVAVRAAGYGNPLEQIYGPPGGRVLAMASGSGVTLTADGFIATNNHVVEGAQSIEVVFPNRRSYAARLVGTDPNTDLALLKVDAKDLPVLKPGNSDAVQVGEWVLAVGYPLSLNTTVTAGIISAKGRSIGIINRSRQSSSGNDQPGNTGIESFLQTDAAINPGNSGGALVNTQGELIGINTAIASQTGSYAGYAFAIPINLASKILDDLKTYGTVKRGVLGVSFPSPATEDQYLKQQGISPGSVQGVYIINVQKESAAAEGGLQEGDFIQRIDGVPVSSSSEFSEWIARHRPGDVLKLTYLRDGKTRTTSVTLKAEEATTKQPQSLEEIYQKLGASFAPLTAAMKQRLNVRSGVVVTDVRSGGFFDQIGIPEGTVIVMINGKPVNTTADINRELLQAQSGLIQILAIAPDGSRVAFTFSLGI